MFRDDKFIREVTVLQRRSFNFSNTQIYCSKIKGAGFDELIFRYREASFQKFF